ncbi:adenine-specific DNA-methyltransferase [Chryseobacterium ureilyticum]|uniref:site-specific DNA-methyltransferase (adenine-specific) n=1 Tax=Chryseobacterium ureilyticum TaxID=373668 RepID=A0A1N7PKB1_9FLAO|nr:DNA methyltransferase [Chryseobacterium ureilyticum]SIT10920.1 adenine-specific DNA-methyltransferase [Chryseobacterium ureilyticum]
MKLYQTLEKQIKKEPNYVSDNGEIKKWVVLNKAQNFDEELIGLLLEDSDLKDKFFVKVKDIWVFKQNLFIQFLEQKNYLNDSYTQFKNKVGLTIDGKHLKQRNEVSLVWPFKDCVLEGGQSREEDKREEIFFNEILAQDEITELLDPKVLTNAKRFDESGEKALCHSDHREESLFNRNENGTITDNLIIKGNNLLALHSLKKEFAGKVKLIYIDPPYNTGSDSFNYNDRFNHSSWLTFMKNRLDIAKSLLTDDGSILVQADWNEIHYLKVLLDSVFNRENFRNEIIWAYHGPGSPKMKQYNRKHDNILWYSKSTSDWIFNGDEVRMSSEVHVGGFNNEMNANVSSEYTDRGKIPEDWWEMGRDKEEFVEEMSNLYDEYEKIKNKNWWKMAVAARIRVDGKKRSGYLTEKPYKLIERFIKAHTNKNDIILDFFAGSGTTGFVSNYLERQFILIEQLENTHKIIKDRFEGMNYTYLELKKYNQTFIEKIEEAKNEETLLQIWEEMKAKSFLNYNVDIQKQEKYIEDFKKLSLQEQKQHLCELLDKNQLYVNLSSLNDGNFECTPEEQKVTKAFYQLKK